jgi:aspartate 1-decarboxylase
MPFGGPSNQVQELVSAYDSALPAFHCPALAFTSNPGIFPAPMHLTLLKSKIHRATVTGASLHYEGSISISQDIAEIVGLRPYEKVLIGNMANGERFETYVIFSDRGTRQIQLNGATAHLGKIGDRLTIMNFASYTADEAESHKPVVIVLNEKNEVVRSDGVVASVSKLQVVA